MNERAAMRVNSDVVKVYKGYLSSGVCLFLTLKRIFRILSRRLWQPIRPAARRPETLTDDNGRAFCADLWGAVAVQEVSENTGHRHQPLALAVSFVD